MPAPLKTMSSRPSRSSAVATARARRRPNGRGRRRSRRHRASTRSTLKTRIRTSAKARATAAPIPTCRTRHERSLALEHGPHRRRVSYRECGDRGDPEPTRGRDPAARRGSGGSRPVRCAKAGSASSRSRLDSADALETIASLRDDPQLVVLAGIGAHRRRRARRRRGGCAGPRRSRTCARGTLLRAARPSCLRFRAR